MQESMWEQNFATGFLQIFLTWYFLCVPLCPQSLLVIAESTISCHSEVLAWPQFTYGFATAGAGSALMIWVGTAYAATTKIETTASQSMASVIRHGTSAR
jgi:hypothetical protein